MIAIVGNGSSILIWIFHVVIFIVYANGIYIYRMLKDRPKSLVVQIGLQKYFIHRHMKQSKLLKYI